jgi:hypothetical protein
LSGWRTDRCMTSSNWNSYLSGWSNKRVLKFLWSWIRDWEDFETLSKMQCTGEARLQKVKAGGYALGDPVRYTDITHAMLVERVFLPGRKITMSISIQLTRAVGQCPR